MKTKGKHLKLYQLWYFMSLIVYQLFNICLLSEFVNICACAKIGCSAAFSDLGTLLVCKLDRVHISGLFHLYVRYPRLGVGRTMLQMINKWPIHATSTYISFNSYCVTYDVYQTIGRWILWLKLNCKLLRKYVTIEMHL